MNANQPRHSLPPPLPCSIYCDSCASLQFLWSLCSRVVASIGRSVTHILPSHVLHLTLGFPYSIFLLSDLISSSISPSCYPISYAILISINPTFRSSHRDPSPIDSESIEHFLFCSRFQSSAKSGRLLPGYRSSYRGRSPLIHLFRIRYPAVLWYIRHGDEHSCSRATPFRGHLQRWPSETSYDGCSPQLPLLPSPSSSKEPKVFRERRAWKFVRCWCQTRQRFRQCQGHQNPAHYG